MKIGALGVVRISIHEVDLPGDEPNKDRLRWKNKRTITVSDSSTEEVERVIRGALVKAAGT